MRLVSTENGTGEKRMTIRMAIASVFIFFVSACVGGAIDQNESSATQQAQEFLPDGGPPVVNGLYEAQGACPFEGCSPGELRARGPVELQARPEPSAPVVATVPPGEWVNTVASINRTRPTRGVVAEAIEIYVSETENKRLEAGEVVYMTDYYGEGEVELWRRGERLSYMGESIRWEFSSDAQRAADDAAGAGWWIEVRRDNGQTGWVLGGGDFDCLGAIDAARACQWGRAGPPTPPRAITLRDCRDCPALVRVPDQTFAIGQYEVTFAQWDACVADGGCNGYTPDDNGWGRGDRPVTNVSWNDAQAYAQWLSRRTRQHYQLPDFDQWELALHPGAEWDTWGYDGMACEFDASAGVNIARCERGQSVPVGSFRPNSLGLYDMIGNVSEWLEYGQLGHEATRRDYVDSSFNWQFGVETPPGYCAHVGPLTNGEGQRCAGVADQRSNKIGFRVLRTL